MRTATQLLGCGAVPKGMARQWVRCKSCTITTCYDYVPYGIVAKIYTMPCGHLPFESVAVRITEKLAAYRLRRAKRMSKRRPKIESGAAPREEK